MSKYISSISITSGTIASQLVNSPLIASGTISSAQLLAMTTPITLIAAPGAGNITVLDSITWSYSYGTATYTGGSAFRICYNNDTSQKAWGTSNSFQTIIYGFSTFGNYSNNLIEILDPALIVNQPVTVSCASNWTTGDGSVKYTISYRIISA